MLPRLLIREDEEVSALVQQSLQHDGVNVRLQHQAQKFERRREQQSLVCEHQGATVEIEFDAVLVAVGRRANTRGFGLEELGRGIK